jgi:hypothetical protein
MRIIILSRGGDLYFLKGFICFWGLHYYGYFRDLSQPGDTNEQEWYLMDDKNCRGLGTSWHDVLLHCIKAHSKPVLILYER